MRAFDYIAPTTVGDAISALVGKGDRARPLAGGTDLIVQLRARTGDVDLVVDVKKIPELNEIVYCAEEGLTLGAAVSCCRIVENGDIVKAYPGLVDAVALIGGAAIQDRATIGGNLCNAAPSGDSIPAMIVLEAVCTIRGPAGLRTVPVESFCTGPGETVLGRGELLVSIHFPPPIAHSGACYVRFIPRHEMDIAVAGAGASVKLSADHATIVSARVALAAIAPTPLYVAAAGAALKGKRPFDESFAEAARLVQEAAQPITDMRGTEAQRRHLAGVLARRALRGAVERAKGGSVHGR